MADGDRRGFFRKLLERLVTATVIAVAVVGVYYGFSYWFFQTQMQGMMTQFGPDSGLSIVEHRERRSEGTLDVLGKIQNDGEDTWQSITIKVEMFDDAGVFVDECQEYVNATLAPGAALNFKATCGGCPKQELPEFDTYTVAITSASKMY